MKRVVVFTVPEGAREERCRSCEASVAWVLTEAGKWMPLSLAKAERNVLGELVAPSHFSDCPNAAQHRRSKR